MSRQAAIDRCGNSIFQLAAGEPFLVDRRTQAAVDQERGARVVTVPDAEDIHGMIVAHPSLINTTATA